MPRTDSPYFYVEADLEHNDWTPAERCVFFALLRLANVNTNGCGAFRCYPPAVADSIAAYDCDGKAPGHKRIEQIIAQLATRRSKNGNPHIILFPGSWLFIRDFWGMGHADNNPNHSPSLRLSANAMPDAIGDAIRDAYPRAFGNAMPHYQDQDQEQEQRASNSGGKKPASGPSKAVARDPEAALADLEARLPVEAKADWERWKALAGKDNPDGQASPLFLASILDPLLSGGHSPQALAHGFGEALRNNSLSPKYIAAIVTKYKPPRANPEQQHEPGQASPPVRYTDLDAMHKPLAVKL